MGKERGRGEGEGQVKGEGKQGSGKGKEKKTKGKGRKKKTSHLPEHLSHLKGTQCIHTVGNLHILIWLR